MNTIQKERWHLYMLVQTDLGIVEATHVLLHLHLYSLSV